MMQPCIECGQPANGSRCTKHQAAHQAAKQQQQNRRRAAAGPRIYDRGAYRRAAATVRATATRCWVCGKGPDPNDPWQADHVQPVAQGGAWGALAPAHRSCNIGRGNKPQNH